MQITIDKQHSALRFVINMCEPEEAKPKEQLAFEKKTIEKRVWLAHECASDRYVWVVVVVECVWGVLYLSVGGLYVKNGIFLKIRWSELHSNRLPLRWTYHFFVLLINFWIHLQYTWILGIAFHSIRLIPPREKKTHTHTIGQWKYVRTKRLTTLDISWHLEMKRNKNGEYNNKKKANETKTHSRADPNNVMWFWWVYVCTCKRAKPINQ